MGRKITLYLSIKLLPYVYPFIIITKSVIPLIQNNHDSPYESKHFTTLQRTLIRYRLRKIAWDAL